MGMIETVEALVTEMGGTMQAAKFFGITPQAVSKMKRKGYVPSRHLLRLQRYAKRKRWKLADELFEG